MARGETTCSVSNIVLCHFCAVRALIPTIGAMVAEGFMFMTYWMVMAYLSHRTRTEGVEERTFTAKCTDQHHRT